MELKETERASRSRDSSIWPRATVCAAAGVCCTLNPPNTRERDVGRSEQKKKRRGGESRERERGGSCMCVCVCVVCEPPMGGASTSARVLWSSKRHDATMRSQGDFTGCYYSALVRERKRKRENKKKSFLPNGRARGRPKDI